MPSPFENPFIQKPDDLKPDAAEFLRKYAGASDEQLRKAGVAKEETTTPEATSEDEAVSLKQAASPEEIVAFENEEVEVDGTRIKRADAIRIQNILKKLNQERVANDQEEVTLGQEIKIDRLAIGGKTKEQLKEELQAANIKTSSYADDLLNSPEFEPLAEPEDVVLVRLTVADLGFPQGATTDEIFAKAQELGLDLCPAETGPQLRVKPDIEQKFGEYFNIAMKQIADSSSRPGVFYLDRDTGEQWLNARDAWPSHWWYSDDRFVFRLRPTSQKLRGAGK